MLNIVKSVCFNICSVLCICYCFILLYDGSTTCTMYMLG